MKSKFIYKLVLSLFVFVLFFSFFQNTAHAGPGTYCYIEPDLAAPHPRHIICPLIRIVNLLLLVSGVGLAVFIGYGAIKLSASLGDPKAFEGALRTFLFAIIGFFVIVGSFALLFILDRTLGLGFGFSTPADIAGRFSAMWDQLMCRFWIV